MLTGFKNSHTRVFIRENGDHIEVRGWIVAENWMSDLKFHFTVTKLVEGEHPSRVSINNQEEHEIYLATSEELQQVKKDFWSNLSVYVDMRRKD